MREINSKDLNANLALDKHDRVRGFHHKQGGGTVNGAFGISRH